jgi:hypothetical protein
VSPDRRPAIRLTARGAVFTMFAASFVGLLLSDWLNWGALGDAVFFMSSGLAAFYVRQGSLLPVVVTPPLLFFTACVLVKMITAADTDSAAAGTMVTLANSAPWLFAGTGLVLSIAMARGLTGEVRALSSGAREARRTTSAP